MKESRHANFGAIQAIFLFLSFLLVIVVTAQVGTFVPGEVKGQMEL